MSDQTAIEDCVLNLTQCQLFDDYTIDEIVEALNLMDDIYANAGDVIIFGHEVTDKMYDVVYRYIQKADPTNVYLTGVGSSERGGKVNLPYSMPSLNQEQIGEIAKWVKSNKLENEDIIITDKMDGTSSMLLYDATGDMQIAYSRGDGIQGADITRHFRKMKSIPQTVNRKMTVRAEVEMTETNFEEVRTKIKRKPGTTYKNARNMMAGIMNSSSRPDFVYDYVNVIAYQILDFEGDKVDQLKQLEEEGFEIPSYAVVRGSDLTDDFLAEHIRHRKIDTDYAIDGIVIDVNCAKKRKQMDKGVTTGNPNSSVKYKITDADNQYIATVKDVEYNISKHGYLKPRVVFHPFDLCGVTIRHATGFNASFIKESGIGPGAKVLISRSGDVIPFIEQIIEAVEPKLPDVEAEWNKTGVDLVVAVGGEEQIIRQIISFCESLSFPNLKEGSVRALFGAGIVSTCEDIVNLELVDLVRVIGANGVKIYNGIQDRLSQVPQSDVMGSVPYFGRGVGKRKFKKLIQQIGEDYRKWTLNGISGADGFDMITAEKVYNGLKRFEEFESITRHTIVYKGIAVESGPLDGQKVCMTGFRDPQMGIDIEDLGGEIASGVSGKTTILVCTDPDSQSGKAKKARQVNESGKGTVEILSVEAFKERLEELK